jgi:dTDP-4-dehydrorhamnose reductase
MKVLITGAEGLVAHHFARKLARDHEVVALTRREMDITDAKAVNERVLQFRPDLIINGAVVQVDQAELDPTRAQAVNVHGPRFLAIAARQVGAEIIHFSSQYVFDGEPPGRAAYTAADEPRPVNNYGRTKLLGEAAVRLACPGSYIVRTSWVYGSGKNSFLCTVHDDLRMGRRVRAIDDIWSSTTYVEDLMDRCLEIVQRRRHGIYHVVNGGVCSYYEFALEAGSLVGLTRERIDELLEVTHERGMRRPAPRPRYTPLRCLLSEEIGFAPMRHWQAALAAHVGNARAIGASE